MVRLLKRQQVCEAVGLTYPTVLKLIRAGRFPAAKDTGCGPRWRSDEVDAWIEALPDRDLEAHAPNCRGGKKKENQ